MRNASTRERKIAYTPMFSKIFVEKSPGRGKSLDDLEMLKAERLKVFWELFSYESHYANKKSIKARLEKILKGSYSILEEVKDLKKSIERDKNSLHEIEKTLKVKFKKKIRKNTVKHTGLAWQEFWACMRTGSDLYCFQILVNQSSFKSKVRVNSCSSSQDVVIKFDCDMNYMSIIKDCQSVISYFHSRYLPELDLKASFVAKKSNKLLELTKNSQDSDWVHDSIDPLYECFDNQCIIGTHIAKHGSDEIFVILFENTSISTYLLQFSYKGKTYNLLSSQHPEKFEILLSLQFSSLSSQKNTLFKSLEFNSLLQSLVKKVKT